MLLADVVATSDAVASTRSRKAKIESLAALLARCDDEEVVPVVGFLTGEPWQGRVGVGWATLAAVRDGLAGPADGATLTVDDLDRVISTVQGTTGAGSAAGRQQALGELFARATDAEADFVFRLLTGELRQGALAGLMGDAIARAADLPADEVRRA